MKKKSAVYFILSVVIVLAAFAYHDKLAQFRSLGLLGIFLINLLGSATIFFPAPAIATVVAGGIVYPPLFVAAVSAIGSTLGEMTGYLLGRSGKEVLLRSRHLLIYVVIGAIFRKYGGIIIFIAAFLPNPFFDIIGIISGIFGYKAKRFIIYVLAARFLRDVLLALSGSVLNIH